MFSCRFHRRHRLTITALSIFVLLAAGCTSLIKQRGPHETVRIPSPQHAYATAQGEVLLAIYIERDMQEARSGWHFVVIDAQECRRIIAMDGTEANKLWQLNWAGSHPNVQVTPPFLKQGVSEPLPLPAGYTLAQELAVNPNSECGQFRLQLTENSQVIGHDLILIPSTATYFPPIRTAVRTILLTPIAAAGFVVGLPFAILFISTYILAGKW